MDKGSKFAAFLVVLMLAGCATADNAKQPDKGGASGQGQTQAKKVTTTPPTGENIARFIGSNRKDLLNQFGQPNMTLDVNIPGRPPAEGYVYYPKDGKGCLHTFVLIEKSGEIIDYLCR